MSRYIINRLILALIIVILVTMLAFLVLRLLPGDPILMYLTNDQLSSYTHEQIEEIRHETGLDRPIPAQYLNWVNDLIHGHLGTSTRYAGQDVFTVIIKRVPITLHIGLLAFIISTILGVLAGVISAVTRGKTLDLFVTIGANLGITIPTFWLGIILIYVFSLKLHLLPFVGYTSPFDNFWLSNRQLIMPVFCLAVFPLGAITRQTRSSVLEIMCQDYVRTARAKGLRERAVIMKHVLKNSLIPIITMIGVQLSHILGGSVLIETVFNIPGMGRLAVDSVNGLDYRMVQSILLLVAIMVVLVNLLVDISYGWFDPRIQHE
jgi:peptide/nickel transport system permease protein